MNKCKEYSHTKGSVDFILIFLSKLILLQFSSKVLNLSYINEFYRYLNKKSCKITVDTHTTTLAAYPEGN